MAQGSSDSRAMANSGELEVIEVTAQKKSTALQSTPIAITAFTGEMFEQRGIDDLTNLQSYVPGLHIGQEQDGFKISLRGIGLQGTSSISDSGVAFYIDNNYIARPAGGSSIFYDIERIEVLRGPQGTLYGRNATGGVVNVISKGPAEYFSAQAGVSVGSRGHQELRGVLNVPINEQLSTRVSAVYTEEEGYVTNTSSAPGADDFFGTDGDTTVRGQMLWGSPETTEVLLSGTYSDLQGTGLNMVYLERNPGGPPPTQALVATIPEDPTDPLKAASDARAFNNTETASGLVRLIHNLQGNEIFFQASYLDQTTRTQQDFDGSPVDISIFNKNQDSTAKSAELRFASDDTQTLSWIVGGYYFAEDTFIFRRVRLNGLAGPGVINLPDFLLDEDGQSETLAAFGTATFAVSDEFRLSLGARHTRDEKTGTKVTRGNFGAPFPPDIPNDQYSGVAKFTENSYMLGAEWDYSEDVFMYASTSTGYKAGGFNLTSNGLPYDPEHITAYEFGIKSDLWNRKAQMNLDVFYYDYQDLQLTTLATVNNAPGQFTTNAAQSTIYGAELETQFVLNEQWRLLATFSYTEAEFDELYSTDNRDPAPVANPNDPAGLGRTDLAGNKVPYVAEHSVSLGLQYGKVLGNGGYLQAAINTLWQGDMYLREFNHPEIDKVEAYTKTDATLGYAFPGDKLSLTLFATNLENDVQKSNVYVSPGFLGQSATTAYTKPRTLGMRVDYRFGE
ncbi:TonB-dependent receptor [Halioxenophilus aromaticivorans]|uniref:TonB-dependent receptor n=1 Tax=Halioxenophilus aromaticivorans TaxID=1306992 RepID=A0AAV3U3A0_9ALTE